MNFCFGDIVVVEETLIGVIVKDWCPVENSKEINHDVYVREYNAIKNYNESEMQRYMVRHKYLSDEELGYQKNAFNGR